MLQTTSKLALILMLATAPMAALAQDTDTATEDAAGADLAQTDAEPVEGEVETAEAEPAPKPVEGQIIMQSENSILANDLIGLSVFTTQDENVGDINDVIITLDGSVEGVVVGVGGFLGMGEKNVAIDMANLDVIEGEQGLLRMTLGANAVDLEAAEPFVTRLEQARELEAETLSTSAPADDAAAQPLEDAGADTTNAQ